MKKSEEILAKLVTGETSPETVKAIADLQAAIATENKETAERLDAMTKHYQELQKSYIDLVKVSAFPAKAGESDAEGAQDNREITFSDLLQKMKKEK